MKIKIILILACFSLLLFSCGNEKSEKNQVTKFAPKERESNLTSEQRREAIATKKAALTDLNVDSIFNLNGVKFSVLPPEVNADLPLSASEYLTSKIIAIAGQNGVGGFCTNPILGLVSQVNCIENGMTATAPQKAIAKYEITFYCGNFITDQIYAFSSVNVTGVGNNFDQAAKNAFKGIKNSSQFQAMFKSANDKALNWYSTPSNVSLIVDQAVSEKNYALAMALLSSVPQQCTSTYDYAVKKNKEVSDLFFESKSDELLAKMHDAINEANGEYSPEVGAYFSLIPHNSKAYSEAKKLYETYEKNIEATRKDKIDRERAVEDQERINAQHLALEQLQVEKIKAPYEAQATLAQINADARIGVAQAKAEGKKNANTGGFLGMGKFWDGTFGVINRLMGDDD